MLRTYTSVVCVAVCVASLVACGGSNSSSLQTPESSHVTRVSKSGASVASDYAGVLQELYISYYGRPGDPAGMAYWEGVLANGNAPTTLAALNSAYSTNAGVAAVVNGFGNSAESLALYGTGNATAFVTAIYNNALGRPPDTGGLNYWVGLINANKVTQSQAAMAIIAGAAIEPTTSADEQLVNNRFIVANYFTSQLTSPADLSAYSGSAANASVRTMLDGVNATTDTTAYEAVVNADIAYLLGAQNYACTSSTSIASGFSGDLNAVYPGGDGPAGTDARAPRVKVRGKGGPAGAGGGEGVVLGALITVTRLADGAVLGSALTDPVMGLVTITPCGADYPLLLTMQGQSGAQYYDEGLGQLTPFGPANVLHTLVDQFDENVGISYLTEGAYQFALNNYIGNPAAVAAGTAPLSSSASPTGLTLAQVQAANQTVLSAINANLPSALQLVSLKTLPTPLYTSSASSAIPLNRYGIAATVIGGFVSAAAAVQPSSSAPALGLGAQFDRDMTDGKLDGVALDGTPAATGSNVYYAPQTLPSALNSGMISVAQQFGNTTTAPVLTSQGLIWSNIAGTMWTAACSFCGSDDTVQILFEPDGVVQIGAICVSGSCSNATDDGPAGTIGVWQASVSSQSVSFNVSSFSGGTVVGSVSNNGSGSATVTSGGTTVGSLTFTQVAIPANASSYTGAWAVTITNVTPAGHSVGDIGGTALAFVEPNGNVYVVRDKTIAMGAVNANNGIATGTKNATLAPTTCGGQTSTLTETISANFASGTFTFTNPNNNAVLLSGTLVKAGGNATDIVSAAVDNGETIAEQSVETIIPFALNVSINWPANSSGTATTNFVLSVELAGASSVGTSCGGSGGGEPNKIEAAALRPEINSVAGTTSASVGADTFSFGYVAGQSQLYSVSVVGPSAAQCSVTQGGSGAVVDANSGNASAYPTVVVTCSE